MINITNNFIYSSSAYAEGEFFCFCPYRAYHSGRYSPRVSAHVVRLALGWVLLDFQPERARAWRVKVSKVFKVFKVSKDARRELRCIWRNSPHGSCTLYSVSCSLASFLRNHLRRPYAQHLVEVITDDEEDDEGGDEEGTEDGECGGEALCHTIDETVSCPVFQEGVEEENEGRADNGGDADEPQVEAAEEQDDVSSLGAVNLTQCHFLLS